MHRANRNLASKKWWRSVPRRSIRWGPHPGLSSRPGDSVGGAGRGAAAPAAGTGAGGRTVGRSARIFTHRRGPITDWQKMEVGIGNY